MTLFKYYDLNKYTISNILKDRLLLRRADSHNDIFEGAVPLPVENQGLDDNCNFENAKEMQREHIPKTSEQSYICCFSRVGDNQVMWALYAVCNGNHNQGFCVEYNEHHLPKYFKDPICVTYTADDRSFFEENSQNARDPIQLLSIKHPDWSHEQEVRYIIPRALFNGKMKFTKGEEELREEFNRLGWNKVEGFNDVLILANHDSRAIKTVTFGVNTPQTEPEIEMLTTFKNKLREKNVRLFRMSADQRGRLCREPIQD